MFSFNDYLSHLMTMKITINRVVGIVMAAILCVGCQERHDDEHKDSVSQKEEHASDEIELSAAQARTIGLKTEAVRPAAFSGVVHVSGVIESSSGEERTVVATADGVVTFASSSLQPGVSVSVGTALATLNAQHLQRGDANEQARQEYESARREYERVADLVKDQIVSKKDFEQIRLRYEQARAAYVGIAQERVGGQVRVSAPMAGYMKDCLVRPGDYVTVGQPLFLLTQTRRLQLRADVPVREASLLPSVHTAHFRTSENDAVMRLADLDGRLVTYARSLDVGTSYLPITFSFSNRGNIVPGSYAEVWLLTATRPRVITVPLTAVTEEQGTTFVYVHQDGLHYRKQEVRLGQDDGLRVEVLSGLRGGERVVVRGAYELRLAAATSAIPEHNHEH